MVFKILITGTHGLVGHAILRKLIKEEYVNNVTCLNKTKRRDIEKNVENFVREADLFQNADHIYLPKYETIDITNFREIEELMRIGHFTVVIHAAGLVSIDENEKTVQAMREINDLSTRFLYHQAKENKVRQFIYISSIECFTNSETEILCYDNLFETKQNTSYGKIKAETSRWLHDNCDDRMSTNIIYPGGVVGAYDHHNSLLGQAIRTSYSNWLCPYIDGEFGFVHNSDIADLVYDIMWHRETCEDKMDLMAFKKEKLHNIYAAAREHYYYMKGPYFQSFFIKIPWSVLNLIHLMDRFINGSLINKASIDILKHKIDDNLIKEHCGFSYIKGKRKRTNVLAGVRKMIEWQVETDNI